MTEVCILLNSRVEKMQVVVKDSLRYEYISFPGMRSHTLHLSRTESDREKLAKCSDRKFSVLKIRIFDYTIFVPILSFFPFLRRGIKSPPSGSGFPITEKI